MVRSFGLKRIPRSAARSRHRPVRPGQDEPALGVGKCVIWIEFDGAVERGQRRLVLAGQSRQRNAGEL